MPILSQQQARTYCINYMGDVLRLRGKYLAYVHVDAPRNLRLEMPAQPIHKEILDSLYNHATAPPPKLGPDVALELSENLFRSFLEHLGYSNIAMDVRDFSSTPKINVSPPVIIRVPKTRRRQSKTKGRVCNNCGVSETRQWVSGRKEIEEWLCHPCGQYWRKNGTPRPAELYNRPVLRRTPRKRSQKHEGTDDINDGSSKHTIETTFPPRT